MIDMDAEKQAAMNLIKGISDGAGRRGVIKNQTIAARQEAEDIVSRARGEAESIVTDARGEAESIREAAHREGVERALAEFEDHLVDIREIRSNVLRDAERDLLKLSVRIAEKILGTELTTNKAAIGDIVSTALRNARQRETVTILVNPSDLETLNAVRGKLPPDPGVQFLDFVADPAVAAGGCVIETEVGKIDARLETQLKVIESSLLRRAEDDDEARVDGGI